MAEKYMMTIPTEDGREIWGIVKIVNGKPSCTYGLKMSEEEGISGPVISAIDYKAIQFKPIKPYQVTLTNNSS